MDVDVGCGLIEEYAFNHIERDPYIYVYIYIHIYQIRML